MKVRTFQNGIHSFYADLSTFLCNTASLGIAIDALQRGGAGGGFASDPHHYFEFGGCRVSKTFVWYPHAALLAISLGKWPTAIELVEDTSIHTSGGPKIGSLKNIVAMSLSAAFVRYFQSQLGTIRLKYGTSAEAWPAGLNFARVIRNAFAHGGEIHFSNLNASSVEWMGIRYSPVDNGRQIIFKDIALAEPILLMEEIDSLTNGA